MNSDSGIVLQNEMGWINVKATLGLVKAFQRIRKIKIDSFFFHKATKNFFFVARKRLSDLAEHPTKFYTDPHFNDPLNSKHIVNRKSNRIQNGDQVPFCKAVKAIIFALIANEILRNAVAKFCYGTAPNNVAHGYNVI